MNYSHILYSAKGAFVSAVLIVALSIGAFFTFEPSVSRAITDDFVVTQQITNEISFRTAPTDVTMAGTIAGITGGQATGTTVVVVNTNNVAGYNMTLKFATTSVSGYHVMVSSSTDASADYISNYTPAVAGVPDYTWVDNSSGQSAEFGYHVSASTSGEVDPSFQSNGTDTCNTGSTETFNRCWLNPTSTIPETIINSSAANAYSTTTIKFKVGVPSAPNPALPAGFYYATGTLTATTN